MNSAERHFDLSQITPSMLRGMSAAEFQKLSIQALTLQKIDRKEHQLFYYVPASERVYDFHRSTARVTGIGGGNGSSKTESAIVETLIHCTGVVPHSLQNIGIDWSKKLRGPIQARMVIENLTTVLEPIILKKLQWFHWTGLDVPGGEKGHWGWIPRACLIDGAWDRSWSAKSRMLRLLYRNPENFEEVIGESSLQFMSFDQDPSDFESGDLHIVHLDEPPPESIFRANEARTMRVAGRILMSMTWPDDPALNVDWIFDEIYEPSRPGPLRNPEIDWIEISTLENRYLNQDSIRAQANKWSERMRAVRIEGRPIRFSNRVHPLFADNPEDYCFACGTNAVLVEGRCLKCGGTDVVNYCHVETFEHSRGWPVYWIIDPHPRKPHMSAYIAVDPDNELWQIAELECKKDPSEMRGMCEQMEREFGLVVRARLMDPKMGASPSGASREITWLDEFARAGLACEPADNADVGRGLVDEYLAPDPDTRRPRMHIHARCPRTVLQFKRFMWDDWKQGADRDQKQQTKKKYDDYPAIWRYLMNARPNYDALVRGYAAIRAVRHGAKRRSDDRRTRRFAAR